MIKLQHGEYRHNSATQILLTKVLIRLPLDQSFVSKNFVQLAFVVGTQRTKRYTNCCLVVKALDFQSRGPVSKTTEWLQG